MKLTKILSVIILLWSIVGCQNSEELRVERLRKEAEALFKTESARGPIIRSSCECVVMEVPSHVNITSLDSWKDISVSSDNEYTKAAMTGIKADKRQLWLDNGMEMAFGDIVSYLKLSNEITKVGGKEVLNRKYSFRNTAQYADIELYGLEKSNNIFVQEGAQMPRGYTLTAGMPVLRLYCQPEKQTHDANGSYLKLIPMFFGDQVVNRQFDKASGFRKEMSDIVFEKILLGGVIKNDTFMCIAIDSNKDNTDKLGNVFMTTDNHDKGYQLLLVFSPRVEVTNFTPKSKTAAN